MAHALNLNHIAMSRIGAYSRVDWGGRELPATTVLLNIGRRHWIINQYDRKSALSRIVDLFGSTGIAALQTYRRDRP